MDYKRLEFAQLMSRSHDSNLISRINLQRPLLKLSRVFIFPHIKHGKCIAITIIAIVQETFIKIVIVFLRRNTMTLKYQIERSYMESIIFVLSMLAHKNVARYYYCSSVHATKLNTAKPELSQNGSSRI